MLIHDAKQLTIRRFTNLLDGSIVPRVSVSMIIDYYEALKSGSNSVVKQNCSITDNFRNEEIAEIEDEQEEETAVEHFMRLYSNYK